MIAKFKLSKSKVIAMYLAKIFWRYRTMPLTTIEGKTLEEAKENALKWIRERRSERIRTIDEYEENYTHWVYVSFESWGAIYLVGIRKVDDKWVTTPKRRAKCIVCGKTIKKGELAIKSVHVFNEAFQMGYDVWPRAYICKHCAWWRAWEPIF